MVNRPTGPRGLDGEAGIGLVTPTADTSRGQVATPESAEVSARRRQVLTQELLLVIVLAAMIAVFGLVNHNFLSRFNLVSTAQDATEVGILAIGELFVIVTAGIDLSVGAILGLAGVVGALAARGIGGTGQLALLAAGLVAMSVGFGCGICNGMMIVKIRISPFVATLAMLGVATGLTLVITSAVDVTPLPALVAEVGNNVYLRVLTIPIIITVILAVLAGLVLHKTIFGRWTYAIGSNRVAARESGIPVRRHIVSVYALSGTLSGIAGFVVMTRLGIGSPIEGTNDNLNAIVAVVIGGASLFGGRGSMFGSIIGAVMLSVILDGLIIVGVEPYWQTVVTGLLLAAAVAFQTLRPGRRVEEEEF